MDRNRCLCFKDLIGKLVKFQRGPATVNGSKLQNATVQIAWEGVASDNHEPGDLPNSCAPKPTWIGGV